MGWAGSGWSRNEALRDGGELSDDVMDETSEINGGEQHAGQDLGHECCCVGAVALARPGGQVGVFAGGGAQEGGDVVGQDLGGYVHEQGLLGQARDAFQVQPVLDAFEGFLDAPALVIEVAEDLGREVALVEIGGQHAHEPAGGCLAHQTHAGSCVGAAEVGHVACAGAVEFDPLLLRAAGHESAGGEPPAGVVTAHDEADAALDEQCDQPCGRGSAVEHQHIVGTQAVEGFEQHLALADLGAVHAGVQSQFGTGQIQREQALITSRGRAAWRMAAAYRRCENRGISGHDAQTAPQRDHGRRALDEPVIEIGQRVGSQPSTCAGEGAIRGHALGGGLVGQAAEEVVQAGLLRLVALAQQGRDQGRQGQLAPPGERTLGIRPSRGCSELGRVNVIAQIAQD